MKSTLLLLAAAEPCLANHLSLKPALKTMPHSNTADGCSCWRAACPCCTSPPLLRTCVDIHCHCAGWHANQRVPFCHQVCPPGGCLAPPGPCQGAAGSENFCATVECHIPSEYEYFLSKRGEWGHIGLTLGLSLCVSFAARTHSCRPSATVR